MAKDSEDILQDTDGDELVANGDFVVGDGTLDDVDAILLSSPGTWKNDGIIGPALYLFQNGKVTPTEIKQRVELHLNRDAKYPDKITVNGGDIRVDM